VLTQNLQLHEGRCSVDFRINEVSKNHNKRAFRVLFECKSSDALYHDISSCVTTKIMVKSKRTKKKGPRSRSKSASKPRKRKREKKVSPSLTPSDLDSDALSEGDSDRIHNEPIRKKARRGSGHHELRGREYGRGFDPHLDATLPPAMANGGDLLGDHTHFVPPALTGILPSIRPGALPRIAHQPPPFAAGSKKNGPPDSKEDTVAGGGVLGHMFSWCKLAGWVLHRLEWTHCGYEYDEATHSIDTRRPLYRCSYCLKYRNEAGWGDHESWCQLASALKEYQDRVRAMHSEWHYQLHSKQQGQMTQLENPQSSPPPSIPLNDGVDVANGNGAGNVPAPTTTQNPVISGFPPTDDAASGPFAFQHHPQRHNGHSNSNSDNSNSSSLWGFAYQSMPGAHSMPFGGPPPMAPMPYGVPPQNLLPPPSGEEVKTEKSGAANGLALPSSMPRIASVSRVHSQHGYDAFDANQQFLGCFDGAGSFLEAEQLNEHYRPVFDPSTMLSRNQSDDSLFFRNLRNSIFDDGHRK